MANGCALLLIDVINGLDFEGSEGLVASAERAAPKIAALSRRARERDVPVIYVNDNFGQWRSDFRATFDACTAQGMPGREVSLQLRPEPSDYFVLKPQHSGFFCTPLLLLLQGLNVTTLVLTGFAANLCVLFTANDAHMHGYRLVVPGDCTASNTPELTEQALSHVATALHGDVRASEELDFEELRRAPDPRRKGELRHV